MRSGDPERVVIQGVIEKVHRRPSVDLSAAARNSSVDNGWVEDSSVDRCMVCATPFSLFSRRHHCRACGNVVCKMCSPNTAIIAEVPVEGYQRVCTQCYWGQDVVYMHYTTPDNALASPPDRVIASTSEDILRDVEHAHDAKGAIEVTRNGSNSSVHSSQSRRSAYRDMAATDVCHQNEDGSLLPIPLFSAKLKRGDGSKVFVNICTNDSLLPTETIISKHVVPDKNADLVCYDYVVHSERAVVYTLLAPDGNFSSEEVSDEVLAAKNEIVYDAVKLISLKYGNLSLSGIEPSYPETRNNHKGKIHPFQRSPSKAPRQTTVGNGVIQKWTDVSHSFISSLAGDDFNSGSVEPLTPPPLKKGWVTILGAGGKGLIGIGNKKRFIVLDAGLLSVYKKESDTPPYGHHKKDSLILDGAVIVDDDHSNSSASFSRRKSTSTDVTDSGKTVVHVSRRGSVFGVRKEVEAKRLFINSPHNGKRIDVECDSVEDRVQWSLALVQHSGYADFRISQPTLVTESFVEEPHSDDTSVVSEADARNSIHSSVVGAKGVRRGTMQPATWAAYTPYMQEHESVLEAGEVSMRIGLLGRYGTPCDLVLTNRGRLYLVDMDARDVDKEIDLIANRPPGSKNCAKVSSDKVFEVYAGNTTYHFKDVTGFKIEKWVSEINTVVNELSLL